MNNKQLIKRISKLAVPMMGGRLFNMLGGFVAMIMVAHLGHLQLAASALILSAQITPFVIFMAILFSIGVVAGQYHGAKEYKKIGKLLQQGCLLGVLLSIPLGIIYWYMGPFLLLVGQNPHLVVFLNEYFHLLAWFAPVVIIVVCFAQFCYGVLRQNIALMSNVIGFAVSVPVAYLFIFGKYGCPHMGVAGMALALVAQSVVQAIYFLVVIYFDKRLAHFEVFNKHQHRGLEGVKQLFTIGWPMCIQFGGELIGWFVIAILVGLLGERDLAAYQVVQQFMVIIFVPIFSVAEAGGILVGHEVGAKQYNLLRRVGHIAIGLTASILSVVMLLFIFIPKPLASLYMNIHDPALAHTVHLIVWLFFINAFVLLLDAERAVISGLLRGLFDTQYAMYVGIIFAWVVSIPLGYVLAFYAHLQVWGFAISSGATFIIACALLYRHWLRRVREYENLIASSG
ncbi:MAG: MATE family efflux transporter [Gammaproteobacteria bacterium]|nr:MATE family efflux transporter [Gammaproteobacteria bacterium]MCH9744855.1 MATE family efflux transporter [Gammaproteobacteria bacterium]